MKFLSLLLLIFSLFGLFGKTTITLPETEQIIPQSIWEQCPDLYSAYEDETLEINDQGAFTYKNHYFYKEMEFDMQYTGQFSEPQKVNDYIYSFTVESSDAGISPIHRAGSGLEEGITYYLCLPGVDVADIPNCDLWSDPNSAYELPNGYFLYASWSGIGRGEECYNYFPAAE